MIFKYKNINISIDERGEGDECLILLHGWGCDNSIYNNSKGYLTSRFKLYCFDLPSFGDSDEPQEVWGTQDYVDMVWQFVREQKIEKLSLMGHSFGGRVSILYASQHDVDKIVLIDSAGIVPKRGVKYYYKVYSFKSLRNICQFLLPKDVAQRVINHFRSNSGSSDYNNASEMMRRVMSKVVNEDLKRVMGNIKASTLLFWGDLDSATPLSDAKTMEKLISDSGLVVAKGCGHFSFLEAPILFESVVKSFFNIKCE